jgi:glucose 1-dehydrogenase
MLMSRGETAMPRDKLLAHGLDGQRALVTGASSGIGEGIARALAQAGAAVVVNYSRGADRAGEVVADICASGGRALAVKADVSQEEEVQAMFATMFEQFQGIDILVNNAGLQQDAPLVDMTLEQWNRVIAINLTGQFRRHRPRRGSPATTPIMSTAPRFM